MRLLAAIAASIALLGAAPTSPAPTSPAPSASSAVTWGVAPSNPTGPNGRAAFTYKLDPGPP